MTTIVDKTSDGVVYRAAKTYPVPNLDILSLLFDSEHCLAKPDTPIHISAADPSLRLTISRARTLTQATSAVLRKHFGIGAKGAGQDICSVISTGHYLLPVLSYGIIGAGGVFSAASAASTAGELSKQIQGAGSKVSVTCDATKEIAVKAAEEAGWGEGGGGRVLLMSEGKDWTLQVIGKDGQLGENLINENDRLPWQKITDSQELEDSLVILIYSSGTTGLPKGVKLSHRNLVAEAVIPGDMFKAWISTSRPNFEYRTVAHLPTAHIAGIQGYLINPFYMGGIVYWMPRFDFAQFLEYNAKYKITFFFTVPPIYLLIAKSPAVTDQFKTLEIAISGAAPLGKELQHAASQKLGGPECFISQTWGLSETTGSATVMPIGMNDDTGSVSPLIPNMLARLVDDNGKDVEPGQPGEVLIKGPVVCKGYYQNAAANAESFTGDWFHTGDIAEFRDGLFYIVDRKKELIKYKGLQVAPAELEAVLLSHPDILDAAVIGIETDDGTNEVPRAYVVADQKKIGESEIVEFVRQNVASHKQLRGGVVFLDLIPKSPAGKILRKDLRVLAKRERGAKL
ncbi:4-coumarate-CoA ligase-like protein [Dothidotthia symphoricarpi CBS 119687]|uniref:4-coumarate-CoA ligase-like protein n=1 Tax=Dothidotthia symphoricarpi CBS 119687 TaxID=1392245 RepID=A0A6A6AJY4_9PLEO|nr:4-coumarate-CoA ligase-like protein [Dothidotthia symphoricarpi CBS 119687]KAF2131187.1 4-coumarate-CoA ligase-like protein [Dothidotthia symphoricarpi CBS 119687]